jgi:hypothetical protein
MFCWFIALFSWTGLRPASQAVKFWLSMLAATPDFLGYAADANNTPNVPAAMATP